MGPVRLGVGAEWLCDGRAFRIVRQLTCNRFVALDQKFHTEQEVSEAEITECQWRMLKKAVRDRFEAPDEIASLAAGRNAIRDVVEAEFRKPSRKRRVRARPPFASASVAESR